MVHSSALITCAFLAQLFLTAEDFCTELCTSSLQIPRNLMNESDLNGVANTSGVWIFLNSEKIFSSMFSGQMEPHMPCALFLGG